MACLRVAVVAVMAMAALTGCQAQFGASCLDGNNRPGTCTAIRSCQPLRRVLQALTSNTAGPNDMEFLRRSVCHLNGEEPLVCCASAGDSSSTPSPRTGGGEALLPDRCGVASLTDRIIDGEDAPLLAWPWMALLRGRDIRQQRSLFFCGGVLINERYVLTAAHCLTPNVELEFVRIGEHTLNHHPDCELGICAPPFQDIPVEEIILHPEYKSPCKECNDIALLRFSQPAQLNNLHVVPICLPVNPVRDMGYPVEEFEGKVAWAAGWGSTSRYPDRPKSPDVLQQVQIPIHTGLFCIEKTSDYPDIRSTLCAGGEGKDTCKGDSGGPLILGNSFSTRNFVVGITSQGPKVCGRNDTQGIYTNVPYYAQWILDNLKP